MTDQTVVEGEVQPPRGNGGEIKDRVRESRQMIPVGPHGVTPQNYGDYVTMAQDLVKATLALPSHLRGNVPLMVAILDISARRNMAPMLVAAHTYEQSGRMCFDSQLFAAFLYSSGLLVGRLRFKFEGDGDETRITVGGRFRENPAEWMELTSQTVKELHPGHVTKEGKQYVKGSPLWDRKPRQQLIYDCQRDWIRAYAPDCVLGMFTREEMQEVEETERARREGERALTESGLAGRLEAGALDTGEGFDGELASAELARIGPAEPTPPPRAARKIETWPREAPPGPEDPPHVGASRERPGKAAKAPPRKPRPGEIKAREEKLKAAPPPKPEKPKPRKAPAPEPLQGEAEGDAWPLMSEAAQKYVENAIGWISEATDPVEANKRWDEEWDERDTAALPIAARLRLKAMLDRQVS